VEQVRSLRSDAWVRPNEADRKVYVLEEADRLNTSAQNAMLKLLEEGPAYAAFLLLTQRANALLPTIRSRCEELALAPVSVPQAEQWLARKFPDRDREQLRQAALDCQGVLGRAVIRLSGGAQQVDELRQQAQTLIPLWLAGDEVALMDLCVPMEKWERGQYTALLDCMTEALGGQLVHSDQRRRIVALLDLIARQRQALAVNVNIGHLAGWLCASCAL
jgi:DNA polymerase-3 subunit delta'